MSLADDIAGYLAAQGGLGLTAGVNLFANDIPATPEVVVAVLAYAGRMPEGTHDDPASIELPHFQVYCRAAQYDSAAAEATSQALYAALRGITNQTINGVFYLSIRAMQSPFLMGRDVNERPEFAFNCEARRAAV